MKNNFFVRNIILLLSFVFILSSCSNKEKSNENYDLNELLDKTNKDFNEIVLNNDCNFLSTIDIVKNIDDSKISILIDKRTSMDRDNNNSYIVKNNLIKLDDIVLDFDQEEYNEIEADKIYYYQKNTKNEIVFPWEKFQLSSKIQNEKNNIVTHLFKLVNGNDFKIEKINKDSSNNNVITLIGELNSIELLDYLSTEFINSRTSILNDINFDVTVIINELNNNYRYKSISLNNKDSNQISKFNIYASFDLQEFDIEIPDEVKNCNDKLIDYEEYKESALIDSEDKNDLYDKLLTFTNEFYDLYDKENLITGNQALLEGNDFLKRMKGRYYESSESILTYDSYWNEKLKTIGSNANDSRNSIKDLFSGNLIGQEAINEYKDNITDFQFDIKPESSMYKLGIYSNYSIDVEDVYGFLIFEKNYECISVYTNPIGLKIYEFKSKDSKNDIYKYIKFIENTNVNSIGKDESLVINFSNVQGEHFFDGKEAFHFLIFLKEDYSDNAKKYIIDFMYDIYKSEKYDIILSKIDDVLLNDMK